jgi:hypothetical protein
MSAKIKNNHLSISKANFLSKNYNNWIKISLFFTKALKIKNRRTKNPILLKILIMNRRNYRKLTII